MGNLKNYNDINVTLKDYVALCEVQRGPHNFFHLDTLCEKDHRSQIAEQENLMSTADAMEEIKAIAERRLPSFSGS